MGINPEQQEVIDLLRNELAEIVDRNLQSFDQESRSHQCEVLEEFCLYADNVGNASKIVGLFGLSKFCDCIQVIFKSLLAQDSLTKEQWEVAPNWAQFILGYLQYYDRPEKQSSSVQKLTLFIKLPIWEDIISAADAEEIDILFSQSKLNIESDSNQYPQSVTADMVSLEIGPEVKPELLQGLRVELPDQVDTFDKAIEQYIVSANVDQLRIAQRIAHTLKGSANIVGIKGIANLMHYVEDILEQSERYDLAADLGDLMLECADCLSSMFEYVAGFGPEPNDTFATMQKVLDILNQNSCGFGGDSRVVSATEPFNKAVEHIGENDAVQSSVSSSEHADDRNSVDASSEKELAINDEDFSVVVDEKSLKPNFDDLLEQADFDVPNTDTLALDIESIDNEIENYAPKEQPNDDLDEDIDFEVTEDFEFEETSIESMPPEELLLTELSPEELSSLKIPEEEVVDEPTVVSLKIVPKKESFQQSELDEEALHNTFSLKEESARELLRLTGETQIANTQIFGRVSAVEQELKITALYHDKLRQISAMLDRFAERQTGAAAAARTGFDTDIDPIELERYNELNTFSSELQEVTTDAFEAVSQIASELKDLKSTIITQRQNSFDSQDI